MKDAIEKARSYIEEHQGKYRAEVIQLPQGAQVKRGNRVIGKLVQEIRLDPSALRQQLQSIEGQTFFPLKLVKQAVNPEEKSSEEFTQFVPENAKFMIEMPQGDQNLADLIFGQLRKSADTADENASPDQANQVIMMNL